ncbi:MAG TPA: hypothetical protein DET40_18220 [Lentisphaeria bacterium]|nr:MAG: hypothetical protein A2X45_25020 [Lentisphaerae bacterium GWF2_50_93]HCE45480.1 hypothetical protein [Lentisphaeria bacterium]
MDTVMFFLWCINLVIGTLIGHYNCIGVISTKDNVAVDGFSKIVIPKCTLAIGTIPSGPSGGHKKNRKSYEGKGYELDYAKGFELEMFEGLETKGIFRNASPVKIKRKA